MAISESNVRFVKDGNIYTLFQKDENSQVKIYYEDKIVNIATKDEVIESLQNIKYKDEVKIYAYVNGECIQLGVCEDVAYDGIYTLVFDNGGNFDTTANVARYDSLTTIKPLSVAKTIEDILFDSSNNELIYDNSKCEVSNFGTRLKMQETNVIQVILDYTTEKELTHNETIQDAVMGVKLDTTYLDVLREIYDFETDNSDKLTFNKTIQHEVMGIKLDTTYLSVERETYDFTTNGDPNRLTFNGTVSKELFSSLAYEEVEA